MYLPYTNFWDVRVGYSRGNKSLAGYEKWASGGQCAQGFKMAVTVLSNSG